MEKSEKIETKSPFIDLWIKSMLVGREGDGYPVFQEDFLRQVSIRSSSIHSLIHTGCLDPFKFNAVIEAPRGVKGV
jgi:hypothetical protein